MKKYIWMRTLLSMTVMVSPLTVAATTTAPKPPNSQQVFFVGNNWDGTVTVINPQLSQGQQPDQNEMLNLLEQQYALVQKGVVKADEAISYIQYLRQILPEMDRFLDRQQAKLEQLKK